MAYRRKKTSYRSSSAKRTYTKRATTSSRRRTPVRSARKSGGRAQVIRLELHHVMGGPQPVPVLGEGGSLQMQAPRTKTAKL